MTGTIKTVRGKLTLFFCLAAAMMTVLCSTGACREILDIGKFSAFENEEALFKEWEPLTFDKIENRTEYTLITSDGRRVIRAESVNAASGLIRKTTVDISRYRVIRWSWKITGTYKKGNVYEKSGDDYPARIYIAFAYDPADVSFLEKIKFNAAKAVHGEYPPVAAINYIWASHAPKGTVVSNPYTDRVKMIVIRSGSALANQWVDEKRDIYEDYKAAFGNPDPPAVSGIAIMTDTDNTSVSAISYYGDIVLEQAPADEKSTHHLGP